MKAKSGSEYWSLLDGHTPQLLQIEQSQNKFILETFSQLQWYHSWQLKHSAIKVPSWHGFLHWQQTGMDSFLKLVSSLLSTVDPGNRFIFPLQKQKARWLLILSLTVEVCLWIISKADWLQWLQQNKSLSLPSTCCSKRRMQSVAWMKVVHKTLPVSLIQVLHGIIIFNVFGGHLMLPAVNQWHDAQICCMNTWRLEATTVRKFIT